jgi:glycine/D-amino acid oxidase-like deaminating enzyme
MTGAGAAEHRVIVVGAGIIGICCALVLRENGFAVTVLDKDGPGEATSFGAAGQSWRQRAFRDPRPDLEIAADAARPAAPAVATCRN